MDKNSKQHDRIRQSDTYEIHHLPKKGMQPVHRDYGLWILHTGSHIAPPDGFHITPERYFEYYAVSHMHGGKGRLWLAPDTTLPIAAGQCVMMPPGQVNRYGGIDGQPYPEDTICFTGPVADMLCKTGVIRAGVYDLGPWRALLQIIQLAADPARDCQVNANIALQKILVDMYNGARQRQAVPDSHEVSINNLLAAVRERTGHWWTVEEMAEQCSLSKDQFRRVFKKQTGMLPKLYIDRLKLKKGAEILIATDRKVADIAVDLGYQDAYHFSRRFKDVMGYSPRAYKNAFSR